MLISVYPALDVSDDEEFIFKPKGKREEDEAWNPKARVGPLLPKTNRPAREGVKKTSVEKGLEAAAAKRAKQTVILFTIFKNQLSCSFFDTKIVKLRMLKLQLSFLLLSLRQDECLDDEEKMSERKLVGNET